MPQDIDDELPPLPGIQPVQGERLKQDIPFTENDDGSITSDDPDAPVEDESEESSFDDNLAESIEPNRRHTIATEILELCDMDEEGRKERDEKYAEGIKRTGMGEDAPGGATFDGASKVVHPILAEGAVDFAAGAIKETFPPAGPVRTQIEGKITPEKLKRAERKRDFLNWQLTKKIQEYRTELEQVYTQIPLSGVYYMKWYWDNRKKRPGCESVPVDKILLPTAAAGFYTSSRFTEVEDITQREFERRVDQGIYIDVETLPSSETPSKTKSEEATDKIEGKESSPYNEDGLRKIYNVHIEFALEEDEDEFAVGEAVPYIISIDYDSGEMLGCYRNWDEEDEEFNKLDWIVEYGFIPWRGAYPVGLVHLIGGLAASLTGSLRALLDSAHINNTPALLKLKGRTGGQNISVDPTGVSEIEGPTGIDDIRKVAIPIPFNQPSTVLFQLLGWLEQAGKGVITTAEEKISQASNQMPVGTTLALIEVGSKVYSSIHARMHRAQEKTLSIISRLYKNHLDDEVVVKELGELIVSRKDFIGPEDVIPVTDPNIFSETQRYAQLQAVRGIMGQNPEQFNARNVIKRELEQLKVPAYEELLVPLPEPQKANPVAENVSMAMGRPATAFPDQDHIAHIQVLLDFMVNPLFGSNPIMAKKFMPLALDHLSQHLIFWYGSQSHDAACKAAGTDVGEFIKQPDVGNKLDQVLSVASHLTLMQASEQFGNLPQLIGQMQKLLQSIMMPPIQDPMMLEVQRKQQKDQVDAQLKSKELELDSNQDQNKVTIDDKKISMDKVIADENNQTELIKNQQDNQTALIISGMEAMTGEKLPLSTGTGINPGN